MPRKTRMYLPGVPAHIVQRGNNRGRKNIFCITDTHGNSYDYDYDAASQRTRRFYTDGRYAWQNNQTATNPVITQWLKHVRDFGRRYAHCAGNVASLTAYAEKHRQCWTKGIATARKVYWPVMGALDSRSSRE